MTKEEDTQPSKKEQTEKNESEFWENLVAILLVVAVIGAITYFAFGRITHTEDKQTYTVTIGDDPIWGNREAPITIVEFSDFSCQYCAQFAIETKPALQPYIEDETVRFIFKDFPLNIHPKAPQVAKAAGCADEQELFWEYHDLVFANQQKQEIADLMSYAEQLDMDMESFEECFASDRRFVEIEQDIQEGRKLNVGGTPTFFINGKKITGIITSERLEELIAEAQ